MSGAIKPVYEGLTADSKAALTSELGRETVPPEGSR